MVSCTTTGSFKHKHSSKSLFNYMVQGHDGMLYSQQHLKVTLYNTPSFLRPKNSVHIFTVNNNEYITSFLQLESRDKYIRSSVLTEYQTLCPRPHYHSYEMCAPHIVNYIPS
ncbi:hypothetical protein AQUCO_00900266v1 [Aquilegia coerulea]|uniref:Uncharacterized protein n=1 Tax=Aquilegia coerulea TaxID=218851 RepID=A0A2G5ECS4_AQUCA|nr:hypothetical protein AQUCO_00900266v1 [Aquilegia coerulea]